MSLKIKTKDRRVNADKEATLKEVSLEKTVTLTILIPESLRANFKVKAIRNKTNISKVLLNYIKEYTTENDNEPTVKN